MAELRETLVIDDVIPQDLQDKFHDLVVHTPSWAFNKDMSYAKTPLPFPSYGFNMMFKHPDHGIISPLYEAVSVPIINALLQQVEFTINDIEFNRAFLQVPLEERFHKEHNGVHIDLPKDHLACVYYLNDSDGDTIIYEQNRYDTKEGSQNVELVEHKRVTPKKGRMVVFDGARYHCSSQPRSRYRAIINFDLV